MFFNDPSNFLHVCKNIHTNYRANKINNRVTDSISQLLPPILIASNIELTKCFFRAATIVFTLLRLEIINFHDTEL